MHTSWVEAELRYEVTAPAHFLLNLDVAHWAGQEIIAETLRVDPQVPVQRYCDERSGNRFVRFDVRASALRVQ